MSLLSRARPADAEARAIFPAFGCPSGGLWYNSELEQPTDTPHLLRCLRCAALNGRSASLCWSCEAELPAGLPLGKPLLASSDAGPDLAPQRSSSHPAFFDALVGGADQPTAPDTAREPAHADPPFSAPLSAVAVDERLAAFSQHRRRVPRRLLGVAAIVVFAAVSGTGAYLIQRPQPFIALDANPAPRHAAAIVEPPVDAEPVTARIAGPSRIEPPPSEPVRTEAAAPARIEPLQQPAAQAAAPPRAAPPPPVVAALTAARGGSARGTRNARNTTAAALPVPLRGESDTVRPPPPTPAPPGTCTATVAALGLCQAAGAQPKE